MISMSDRASELFERACALEAISAILGDAADLGSEVYLVGGTVRDLLLGRPFLDVDLAVDGDALRLAAAIGAPDGTESRFGTLRVSAGAHRYDLARTRSERYAHPGALPEVRPARIDADLSRRDFTVNAIALGLSGPRAGELLAVPGALADLDAGRLAVLHDRSFRDDPTRLLRLARYAARLGFAVAPRTAELAAQAITGGALDTVSGTRIGNELRLLAGEPDPVAAFAAAAELGLPWRLDRDLARRALELLPEDGRADLLVLACVFGTGHDPGQRDGLPAELDRLGFPAGDRDTIAQAAAGARDLARRLQPTTSNAQIARAVGAAALETVTLAACHGAPSQAATWLRDLRHRRLQITGDDLIGNGVPEGPELGAALARARDALMDGAAVDRDAQLAVALRPAS